MNIPTVDGVPVSFSAAPVKQETWWSRLVDFFRGCPDLDGDM